MNDKVKKCLHTIGLSDDASLEDIKRAYQKITKEMRDGSIPWEQSKEILWSYDYLIQYFSEEPSNGITENREEKIADSRRFPNKANIKSRNFRIALSVAVLFLLSLSLVLFFKSSFFKTIHTSSSDIDTSYIIRKIKPSIVTIKTGDFGTGSGFVVSKDGFIATNAHVMKQKNAVAVFSDGFMTDVNLVMLDGEKDFALVKAVENKGYSYLSLGDSNSCQEGDTVVAAGAPVSLEFSFTKGIISSMKRSLPFLNARLIQTDAAINPGNSGGPLINGNGDVIGINFLKIADSAIEGIGFAIAINDVKQYIDKKQYMSDNELNEAMDRAEKKLLEYTRVPDEEMNRARERAIEEQWERERRRREFNEKVEAANKDLREQKENAEKQLQEEVEQQRKRLHEIAEARKRSLSECLQGATNRYQSAWNEYCKKLNKQDNCALPSGTASVLEQRYGQMRNECYRLNSQ